VVNGVASTMDIFPTVANLCGASRPANPLDGIDIWGLLSGASKSLEREALLFFDDWNLQCARWGRWKLHLARYNAFAYGPAPALGRVNLPLASPELYDLELDPDESYDVAAERSEAVKEILARVERLIPGFPREVVDAWEATRARRTHPSATGALPRS
jgi:arylsulfatase